MKMTPAVYKYLADPFERAGKQFLQVFVVAMLASSQGAQLFQKAAWFATLDVAGFSALATLIAAYVLAITNLSIANRWVDLIRRAVLTWLSAFAAVLFGANVTPSLVHAGWHMALTTASVTAAVAVLHALLQLSAATVGTSTIPVAPALPEVPAAPVKAAA